MGYSSVRGVMALFFPSPRWSADAPEEASDAGVCVFEVEDGGVRLLLLAVLEVSVLALRRRLPGVLSVRTDEGGVLAAVEGVAIIVACWCLFFWPEPP